MVSKVIWFPAAVSVKVAWAAEPVTEDKAGEPPPAGVAHVLSPRRNVVELGVPVALKSAIATRLLVSVWVLPAKCPSPTPGALATTHVAQVKVPVPVIGPPPSGDVVATLVTVPGAEAAQPIPVVVDHVSPFVHVDPNAATVGMTGINVFVLSV